MAVLVKCLFWHFWNDDLEKSDKRKIAEFTVTLCSTSVKIAWKKNPLKSKHIFGLTFLYIFMFHAVIFISE